MMSVADAFYPAVSFYAEKVKEATWGHLAPIKNKKYKGSIIFAFGCYDSGYLNPTPLSVEFDGLEDSPWLYEAIDDFLGEYSGADKEGKVFRFDGCFKNYHFEGSVRQLTLS